jgi:hypothetical protein
MELHGPEWPWIKIDLWRSQCSMELHGHSWPWSKIDLNFSNFNQGISRYIRLSEPSLTSLMDSTNWQVYQPRHKRRKPKTLSGDPEESETPPAQPTDWQSKSHGFVNPVTPPNPRNPPNPPNPPNSRIARETPSSVKSDSAKKSEADLVGDLIHEINSGLDLQELTETEVRMLERRLGYAWYEIFGYDENPVPTK